MLVEVKGIHISGVCAVRIYNNKMRVNRISTEYNRFVASKSIYNKKKK